MPPPDYTTTTVDGAAGHAALYAEPVYDSTPTHDEAMADQWPSVCEGCDGTGGSLDEACDLCGGEGER